MSRVHIWQTLLNNNGEPIPAATINIYLAGTETPASIYPNESSGTVNTSGSIQTLSNGFFEFWIADDTESNGYSLSQKFKLAWNKPGISSGHIDYFEVFNESKEYAAVDVTSSNTVFNKFINNALGNKWETHVDSIYSDNPHGLLTLDPTDTNASTNRTLSNIQSKKWEDHADLSVPMSAHGLSALDPTDTDTEYTRILSNLQGKKWEDHTDTQALSSTPTSSAPHGIEGVDETDTDTTKNKLVSNNQMKEISDTLITVVSNVYDTWSTHVSGYDYIQVTHSSSHDFPMVGVWDTSNTTFDPSGMTVKYISAGMLEVQAASGETRHIVVKVMEE